MLFVFAAFCWRNCCSQFGWWIYILLMVCNVWEKSFWLVNWCRHAPFDVNTNVTWEPPVVVVISNLKIPEHLQLSVSCWCPVHPTLDGLGKLPDQILFSITVFSSNDYENKTIICFTVTLSFCHRMKERLWMLTRWRMTHRADLRSLQTSCTFVF